MTSTTSTASPHPDASRGPAGGGRLKLSEALRKARELITPEGAWIKNASARDALGNKLDSGDEVGAVCFCAIGAIEAAMGRHDRESLVVIDFMRKQVVPDHIFFLSHWNDKPQRTKKQVLNAFDRAVALAEADESARTSPSPGPAGADGAAAGGGAK